MFSWLKRLFDGPEPLPPLGFKPRFLDPDSAPSGSVIVAMENDDVTPMEFVVQVLTSYFDMSYKQAIECMIKVHTDGSGEIRTMSAVDAKKLLAGIEVQIKAHGHPLKCYIKQAPLR